MKKSSYSHTAKLLSLIGLVLIVWNCSKGSKNIEPDLTSYSTKARIVEITCAGQIVQLLGSDTADRGEDFWGRSKLTGVQNSSNPADTTYKHCVRLAPIPKERIVLGDTLVFNYRRVSYFENACLIGLPIDTLYQITKLKGKAQ